MQHLGVVARLCLVIGVTLAACPVPSPAADEFTFPERIGQRDFILDSAMLMRSSDRTEVRRIADKCLTDRAVPIIVVTVDSLSDFGAQPDQIEPYARALFDHWGIGYQVLRGKLSGKELGWNYGMLLLVARNDRKARIEMGADWAGRMNGRASEVMQNLIIPRFKEGNYSDGILQGVRGLDAIARELPVPSLPLPWWYFPAIIAVVVLIVMSARNMYLAGTSGWAWLFWAGVMALLIQILVMLLSSARWSGDSAGFSGGSFGGGSGGGGGATGSW